ncbi:MAG: hypothetical protein JSR80_04725 [Verrucomicrobia bacterium]|nr:hypothetical protein [Verrucomicrobiota bacterium]
MAKDEAIAKVALGGFFLALGAALFCTGRSLSGVKNLFPDPVAGTEAWRTCLQNWQAVNAHSGTLQQLRKLYDACPINSRSVFFEQADVLALLQKIPPQHHSFFQNVVREWSASWMSFGKRVSWPYAERMSRVMGESSEMNRLMWLYTMDKASIRLQLFGAVAGVAGAGLAVWGGMELT